MGVTAFKPPHTEGRDGFGVAEEFGPSVTFQKSGVSPRGAGTDLYNQSSAKCCHPFSKHSPPWSRWWLQSAITLYCKHTLPYRTEGIDQGVVMDPKVEATTDAVSPKGMADFAFPTISQDRDGLTWCWPGHLGIDPWHDL